MSERHDCSERVFSGERWDFKGHPCAIAATVERDGKWYCRVHDPEVKAERRSAKNQILMAEQIKRDAEWDLDDARIALAEAAGACTDFLGMSADTGLELAKLAKAYRDAKVRFSAAEAGLATLLEAQGKKPSRR